MFIGGHENNNVIELGACETIDDELYVVKSLKELAKESIEKHLEMIDPVDSDATENESSNARIEFANDFYSQPSEIATIDDEMEAIFEGSSIYTPNTLKTIVLKAMETLGIRFEVPSLRTLCEAVLPVLYILSDDNDLRACDDNPVVLCVEGDFDDAVDDIDSAMESENIEDENYILSNEFQETIAENNEIKEEKIEKPIDEAIVEILKEGNNNKIDNKKKIDNIDKVRQSIEEEEIEEGEIRDDDVSSHDGLDDEDDDEDVVCVEEENRIEPSRPPSPMTDDEVICISDDEDRHVSGISPLSSEHVFYEYEIPATNDIQYEEIVPSINGNQHFMIPIEPFKKYLQKKYVQTQNIFKMLLVNRLLKKYVIYRRLFLLRKSKVFDKMKKIKNVRQIMRRKQQIEEEIELKNKQRLDKKKQLVEKKKIDEKYRAERQKWEEKKKAEERLKAEEKQKLKDKRKLLEKQRLEKKEKEREKTIEIPLTKENPKNIIENNQFLNENVRKNSKQNILYNKPVVDKSDNKCDDNDKESDSKITPVMPCDVLKKIANKRTLKRKQSIHIPISNSEDDYCYDDDQGISELLSSYINKDIEQVNREKQKRSMEKRVRIEESKNSYKEDPLTIDPHNFSLNQIEDQQSNQTKIDQLIMQPNQMHEILPETIPLSTNLLIPSNKFKSNFDDILMDINNMYKNVDCHSSSNSISIQTSKLSSLKSSKSPKRRQSICGRTKRSRAESSSSTSSISSNSSTSTTSSDSSNHKATADVRHSPTILERLRPRVRRPIVEMADFDRQAMLCRKFSENIERKMKQLQNQMNVARQFQSINQNPTVRIYRIPAIDDMAKDYDMRKSYYVNNNYFTRQTLSKNQIKYRRKSHYDK